MKKENTSTPAAIHNDKMEDKEKWQFLLVLTIWVPCQDLILYRLSTVDFMIKIIIFNIHN